MPEPMSTVPRSRRFWRFWKRHRTLLWTLHSVWALLTGVVVLLLARERYGFVPWVVAFLALTWASTLYLGRRATSEGTEEEPGAAPPGTVAEEVTSYLTRGLYQETLFFLLPFYAYSTVIRSPNVLFVVLLSGLALLACLDMVFDRWMRTSPVFGLVFFATVAYAATNLVLPMLVGLAPSVATVVAACIAVGSAVPLAMRGSEHRPGERIRLVVAAAVILAVAIGVPGLVPPVPLRLEEAAFATGIERETLELSGVLPRQADASDIEGVLIMRARVFAPSAVPTQVSLDWKRDGEIIRTSREIEITAHDVGFRIWDSWRPEEGPVPPGRYEVVLRTPGHRVFGIVHLLLVPRGAEP